MSNAPENPRKALGKGLSSLLPGRPSTQTTAAGVATAQNSAAVPITKLPIQMVHPNPLQPRNAFDQARLEELAQSIQANELSNR